MGDPEKGDQQNTRPQNHNWVHVQCRLHTETCRQQKSKSNKNDETVTALTNAGLIRNPANNTTIVQTDKAALYTGAASVINNVLDTFFSGNNNNSNSNSSNSSTKLTNDEWDKEYGDIFY